MLVRRYCTNTTELEAISTLTRRDLLSLFDDRVRALVPAAVSENWLPPDRREDFLVLWIEDNRDQQIMYQHLLQEYEFPRPVSAVTAYHGDVGLVLAWLLVPDLIFSDILHPGTSGLEMRAILADHPLTTDIPFVLATGYADADDRRLVKPLDPDQVAATVRAYMA